MCPLLEYLYNTYLRTYVLLGFTQVIMPNASNSNYEQRLIYFLLFFRHKQIGLRQMELSGADFGTPVNVSWNSTEETASNLTDLFALDDRQDSNTLTFQIKEVMFIFQYVTMPIILVIGLFGNFLTIVTMASQKFKHLTSRYILIALAISDTTLLLTQPFNKLWMINLFGTDVRAAFSDIGCKIFFHIFKTGKMTSSWLVVLLCCERFIAVVFPLHAKRLLRRKVILCAIALDYLIIGSYNAAMAFSSGIQDGVCKPDLPSPEFKYFIVGACILYSFLPSAILLVLTPQIMIRIMRHVRIHRMMTSERKMSTINQNETTTKSRKEDEMMRASVMVVGVMIAFIVLVLPIAVVHLYASLTKVSAFDQNSLGFFIFREIAQILEQVNYAINFFIYVLYSSVFRRRVSELLCMPCCLETKNKQHKMLMELSFVKLSYGSYKLSPGSGEVSSALSSGSSSTDSPLRSTVSSWKSDKNQNTKQPRLLLFTKVRG